MPATAPARGTLKLDSDGSFTYIPNADFSGTDRFAYRVTDGTTSSDLATVTITVNAVAEVTGALTSASDTGVSHTDRITGDSTPTYSGTAPAGLEVRLMAQRDGQATPVAVGMTRADSAGHFAVTSVQLADGFYHFFAEAFGRDGRSTGRVAVGDLLIDTVAPRITGARLGPQAGQIVVSYHDDASGLEASSVLTAANYAVSRLPLRPRRSIMARPVISSSMAPARRTRPVPQFPAGSQRHAARIASVAWRTLQATRWTVSSDRTHRRCPGTRPPTQPGRRWPAAVDPATSVWAPVS